MNVSAFNVYGNMAWPSWGRGTKPGGRRSKHTRCAVAARNTRLTGGKGNQEEAITRNLPSVGHNIGGVMEGLVESDVAEREEPDAV